MQMIKHDEECCYLCKWQNNLPTPLAFFPTAIECKQLESKAPIIHVELMAQQERHTTEF